MIRRWNVFSLIPTATTKRKAYQVSRANYRQFLLLQIFFHQHENQEFQHNKTHIFFHVIINQTGDETFYRDGFFLVLRETQNKSSFRVFCSHKIRPLVISLVKNFDEFSSTSL